MQFSINPSFLYHLPLGCGNAVAAQYISVRSTIEGQNPIWVAVFQVF